MKNKYAKRSRISEAKVRQIVKLFAVDLNALQIAEIAGINHNSLAAAGVGDNDTVLVSLPPSRKYVVTTVPPLAAWSTEV